MPGGKTARKKKQQQKQKKKKKRKQKKWKSQSVAERAEARESTPADPVSLPLNVTA